MTSNPASADQIGEPNNMVPASVGPAPDGEVCLRERYAEDWDVCGCKRCLDSHRAPHPDREAEPTGGVVERLKAAVDDQHLLPGNLIRDAYEALSVSPPVVEGGLGALRASPCVPTEGQEAAVLAQAKAIERIAMDAACTAWRGCRPAMVKDGEIVGYPCFSMADLREVAALYPEQAAVSADTQPGILRQQNEPEDRHQPTTPGEQDGA